MIIRCIRNRCERTGAQYRQRQAAELLKGGSIFSPLIWLMDKRIAAAVLARRLNCTRTASFILELQGALIQRIFYGR
jgi:hypothetical protein